MPRRQLKKSFSPHTSPTNATPVRIVRASGLLAIILFVSTTLAQAETIHVSYIETEQTETAAIPTIKLIDDEGRVSAIAALPAETLEGGGLPPSLLQIAYDLAVESNGTWHLIYAPSDEDSMGVDNIQYSNANAPSLTTILSADAAAGIFLFAPRLVLDSENVAHVGYHQQQEDSEASPVFSYQILHNRSGAFEAPNLMANVPEDQFFETIDRAHSYDFAVDAFGKWHLALTTINPLTDPPSDQTTNIIYFHEGNTTPQLIDSAILDGTPSGAIVFGPRLQVDADGVVHIGYNRIGGDFDAGEYRLTSNRGGSFAPSRLLTTFTEVEILANLTGSDQIDFAVDADGKGHLVFFSSDNAALSVSSIIYVNEAYETRFTVASGLITGDVKGPMLGTVVTSPRIAILPPEPVSKSGGGCYTTPGGPRQSPLLSDLLLLVTITLGILLAQHLVKRKTD